MDSAAGSAGADAGRDKRCGDGEPGGAGGASGHRLIATMHAGDPAAAVAQALEMGIEPYQVTSSLFGVLTQRLLRRRAEGAVQGAGACGGIRRVVGDGSGAVLSAGGCGDDSGVACERARVSDAAGVGGGCGTRGGDGCGGGGGGCWGEDVKSPSRQVVI